MSSWFEFFKLPPIKHALRAGTATMLVGTAYTTYNALKFASECADVTASVSHLPQPGDSVTISGGEASIKALNQTLLIEVVKITIPMPEIGFDSQSLKNIPSYCEEGAFASELYTTLQIATAIAALVAIAVLSRDFYNNNRRNASFSRSGSVNSSLSTHLMDDEQSSSLCCNV